MAKPFKCPVCGGTGKVPHGFYDQFSQSTTDITPDICRACYGTGIIWKSKKEINSNINT